MSTPPKKSSKNKGGRPPRAPGEKLQRVSLSLKPRLLFGLEIVARDRRTSLSQAAEHLIEQQLREYKVDGRPASELLDDAAKVMKNYVEKGDPINHLENADIEQIASRMLSTEAGRAFFIPPSLQQPAERYLRALYLGLLSRAREEAANGKEDAVFIMLALLSAPMSSDPLTNLFALAKEDEQRGAPIEESVAEAYKMLLDMAEDENERGD